MIVDGGQWTVSGGTSASGPIWNGIITLLNDYLLTNGKPTLGFVNPLLYKIAASTPNAFNRMALSSLLGPLLSFRPHEFIVTYRCIE